MSENTILQISEIISNDIDLSNSQKIALKEIEFSINKINNLLENEIVRRDIVKKELRLNKDSNNQDLLDYLDSIEKNIKKLDLFLDILENKKKVFIFDVSSYFKSLKTVNINKPLPLN